MESELSPLVQPKEWQSMINIYHALKVKHVRSLTSQLYNIWWFWQLSYLKEPSLDRISPNEELFEILYCRIEDELYIAIMEDLNEY
jgi:hypothetical protein